jgi:hypothetical protein
MVAQVHRRPYLRKRAGSINDLPSAMIANRHAILETHMADAKNMEASASLQPEARQMAQADEELEAEIMDRLRRMDVEIACLQARADLLLAEH